MKAAAWRWVAASVVMLVAALPVSSTAVRAIGLQRSTWIRITLAEGSAPAPPLRIRYGPSASLPILWDAQAPDSLLGISTSRPARLLAIDTDRGVLPPWMAQTWASGWERSASPPSLSIAGPGVVDALGAFRRFTLTFAPAPATVAIGWLDARVTLDLSTGPSPSITLQLPTERRGWVLLPATPIDRLALIRDAHAAPVLLSEVAVRGARRQNWTPVSLSRATPSPGACVTTLVNGSAQIAGSAQACELPLDGLGPFNRPPAGARAGIWLLAAGCGLVLLAAVRAVSVRWPGRGDAPAPAHRDSMPSAWSRARVLTVVLACTSLYHLTYAVAVPPHFNYDSLGYYAFGRNLWFSRSLDAVGTCRTPGYPALIALSYGLFGDRLLPIVVAQHLALCGLGALTAWALYHRIGPWWSGLAGLLAGLSPIVSLTASTIWTESLFVVLSLAALLVFVKAEEGEGWLPIAGMLAGAATLVRPNGVLVPGLMAAWLILVWWCGTPTRARLWTLVRSTAAVAAGFIAVTAFWFVHFHRVTGHWGVTDASCSMAEQTRTAVASGSEATNIFQLAGFSNVISQSDDVRRLAVTEPYRAFFEFFPARHRYYVSRFLPAELTYDDRFTGEVFREYIRVFPALYARQVADALLFNLTHAQRAASTVFVYPDLVYAMDAIRERLAHAPAEDARVPALRATHQITWPDAEVLLPWMARARPALAGLARLHLAGSRAAMAAWGIASALGLLGGLWCLLADGKRRVTVLTWHAIVLVAAPAVLAMGADRYAMVAEPAFYVLAVTMVARVPRGKVAVAAA